MTAIVPAPFQNCTREGSLPGCLFKFDHPEEQCTQRRTGERFYIKISTNLDLCLFCRISVWEVSRWRRGGLDPQAMQELHCR